MKQTYKIAESEPPALDGRWNSDAWKKIPPFTIAHFHARSALHRPIAEGKVCHSDEGLHVMFRVLDRFVRVANVGFQSPVWKDSCVEFFVRPRGTGGYFNFEMNAGGSLLLYFIEDWTRVSGPDEFKKVRRVEAKWNDAIRRFHNLPERVEPERATPCAWLVQYTIPWALFAENAGVSRPQAGDTWTGNFYKCGDETSQPHWATWSPIGEALNFHAPEFFGQLVFA